MISQRRDACVCAHMMIIAFSIAFTAWLLASCDSGYFVLVDDDPWQARNAAPDTGSGGLTASDSSPYSIRVAWSEAIDDVDEPSELVYRLYYSLTDNIGTVSQMLYNGTPVGSFEGGTTSRLATGLDPETAYFFNVVVQDTAGNQAEYSMASFATTEVTAPDNPPDTGAGTLTDSDNSPDSIRVSWSPAIDDFDNHDDLTYQLFYCETDTIQTLPEVSSNGIAAGLAEYGATTQVATGLMEESEYFFNVVVTDTAGNRSVYVSASFTTADDKAPQAIPGTLTDSENATHALRLSWAAATDDYDSHADLSYRIYYSLSGDIGTVSEAVANGTPTGPAMPGITTAVVTGLEADTSYYFNVLVNDTAGNTAVYTMSAFSTTAGSTPGGAIVADHTVVDRYDDIPQYWIDQVKTMLLVVPGESHGRGYVYGLELLEALDPRFAVNATWTGEPEEISDQHLRIARTFRRGSGWDTTGGEEDFWTNAPGREMMEANLDYMRDTLGNPISAFGFGWCWDMTWHNGPEGTADLVYGVRWAGSSVDGPAGDLRWGIDDGDNVLTGNDVNLHTYLSAVDRYNDHDPDTVTFFTTGPVDGYPGESGYQRYLKHEEIRAYVEEVGGVLFDYADILCWEDGAQYTTSWDGHTFQIGDPDLAPGGVGYDGGDGGCHISEEGCLRLAKGLWWMLARIAGWDGT